jgi:hypothetical protein
MGAPFDHIPAPSNGAACARYEQKETRVVSSTKQTNRRRRLRASQRGRWNKKTEQTPVFPVQPPGYDANAADAKKPAAS